MALRDGQANPLLQKSIRCGNRIATNCKMEIIWKILLYLIDILYMVLYD